MEDGPQAQVQAPVVVSASARLAAKAAELEQLLREFLLEHSGLTDVTGPGVTWIVVGQERKWNELDAAGRALQSRLLADYGRFSSLVDALFRFAPDRVRRDAATAAATVRAVIDQSEGTSHETTAEVLEVALAALRVQVQHVANLPDPSAGEPLYVPDANAVIWNPNLEDWSFDGVPTFRARVDVDATRRARRLENAAPGRRTTSEGGAHPKVISDQLGHASVQITMERYSHLFEGAYADVSDELEKAWSGTETAAETMTTAVVSR